MSGTIPASGDGTPFRHWFPHPEPEKPRVPTPGLLWALASPGPPEAHPGRLPVVTLTPTSTSKSSVPS